MGELRRLFRSRLGLDAPKSSIDREIESLGRCVSDSASIVGELVSLTFEEKRKLGIRTVQCCDATPVQVSEFYRIERQQRQNRRRRLRRLDERREKEMASEMHPRAIAILDLIKAGWKTAPQLALDVARNDAYLDSHRCPLAASTLRQAVHRALDELLASGAIEQRIESGPRGVRVRHVRLSALEPISRECGRISVTVRNRDPVSPLQENGRTSGAKRKEPLETSRSDRDREVAALPKLTVTKKQPHINTISAAIDFPDLPSVLDRRVGAST